MAGSPVSRPVEQAEAEACEVEQVSRRSARSRRARPRRSRGHAAGHRGARMDRPAADQLDDPVPGAARLDDPATDFQADLADDSEDVPRSATGASGPTRCRGPPRA